jgi:hypothetical protein
MRAIRSRCRAEYVFGRLCIHDRTNCSASAASSGAIRPVCHASCSSAQISKLLFMGSSLTGFTLTLNKVFR